MSISSCAHNLPASNGHMARNIMMQVTAALTKTMEIAHLVMYTHGERSTMVARIGALSTIAHAASQMLILVANAHKLAQISMTLPSRSPITTLSASSPTAHCTPSSCQTKTH